jgi:hypothetical protein
MTQMFPREIPERGIRRDDPIDGEFRFRLGELFEPRQDFWWNLSPPLTIQDTLRQQQLLIQTGKLEEEFPIEKARARIPDAVKDALVELLETRTHTLLRLPDPTGLRRSNLRTRGNR